MAIGREPQSIHVSLPACTANARRAYILGRAAAASRLRASAITYARASYFDSPQFGGVACRLKFFPPPKFSTRNFDVRGIV